MWPPPGLFFNFLSQESVRVLHLPPAPCRVFSVTSLSQEKGTEPLSMQLHQRGARAAASPLGGGFGPIQQCHSPVTGSQQACCEARAGRHATRASGSYPVCHQANHKSSKQCLHASRWQPWLACDAVRALGRTCARPRAPAASRSTAARTLFIILYH